jgi:Leucine-rich repeat (LRR) protein
LEYLQNLTHLDLFENPISTISAIQRLKKLIDLNLGSLQIEDISALENLTNLKDLNLANNQLKNILALKQLINLEHLNLFKKQIDNLSPLKLLCNLKKLGLNSNNIKILPDWITDFSLMNIFYTKKYMDGGITIFNNPIEIPPIDVIKKGKFAIKQWYKNSSGLFN